MNKIRKTKIGSDKTARILAFTLASVGALTILFLTSPIIARAQEKIAFTRSVTGDGPQIFVMDPDGMNQTQLTSGPGLRTRPAFSPEGSKIVFEYRIGFENPEIYVINADGAGVESNLTDHPGHDAQPSFSPDGSKIVFMSSRNGGFLEIYVMNSDGTDQTRLTNNNCAEEKPSFNPDGSRILYAASCNGVRDIYVMNSDGSGQPTRLTDNSELWWSADYLPSFSPDGNRIVFASFRAGPYEIYVMDADGTNINRLTFTGTDDQPSFSPDGNRIVFMSGRDNAGDQVYVMKSDGSDPVRLTTAGGYFPTWWGPALTPPPPPPPTPTPTPNTPAGTNVTVTTGPATVTFSVVTQAGDTTVTIVSSPPPPSSFDVDGEIYDISTTATYVPPITVCLPYSPSNPAPAIWHYEDVPPLQWVEVTTFIDTANNLVCGEVGSLSPFVVTRPQTPDPTPNPTPTPTPAPTPTPIYNFGGFFHPVENFPILNVVNAGSSIPVKFSLGGDHGLSIFAPGYPVSSPIACDASEPGVVIQETATPGNSSLSYDAATGQYAYVWKTEKGWKRTCRMLVLKLTDGTEHLAKFRFR